MLFRECYNENEMRASIANQKELVYRVMAFNHDSGHAHATAASNALLANVSICSSFGGSVGPAVRAGGGGGGAEARHLDLTKSYGGGARMETSLVLVVVIALIQGIVF